jgi:hypothetical protein
LLGRPLDWLCYCPVKIDSVKGLRIFYFWIDRYYRILCKDKREKITARGRKIKRGRKTGSVIVVTGCAGLAHATRLGPNSPFFNALLAIYTFLYFLFCIITYQFSEEPIRQHRLYNHIKKISVFIENRMI